MRRAFAPAAVLVLFAACVSADRLAPTFALVASGALAGSDEKLLRNKLDLAITLLSRDLRIAAVNQLEESVRSLPGGGRRGGTADPPAPDHPVVARSGITNDPPDHPGGPS